MTAPGDASTPEPGSTAPARSPSQDTAPARSPCLAAAPPDAAAGGAPPGPAVVGPAAPGPTEAPETPPGGDPVTAGEVEPGGALGAAAPGLPDPRTWAITALFVSTFVVATCGLVYELVAGALGSYLLGDSVTQFSVVIGLYLSAMGVGSWLSKYLRGDLLARFLEVEVAVGVIGGCSALAILHAHAFLGVVRPVLYGSVFVTGALVGLEIPVLMRVLRDQVAFSELVARVLAFDYLGALAASLLFPLLLVPALGLPRTALVFGLLNTTVALVLGEALRDRLGRRADRVRWGAGVATAGLLGLLVWADQLALVAERAIYEAPILVREKSPYQTIVLTRAGDDLQLYLDGHLQFSAKDEHRYHEALVHPAVASLSGPVRTALVIGGGDGMALRELLRYESLERVVLVDLDPVMTGLFRDHELLRPLNADAYHDPRVTVVNQDAMTWLEEHDDVFDVAVVDLPDPRNYAIGKCYTVAFYRLLHRHVAEGGAAVVQATSPWGAPRAFWCIAATLEDAEWTVHPFHAWVPSFGEWGFVLALRQPRGAPERLAPGAKGLRFLDDAALRALFVFPRDMQRPEGLRPNRLGEQVLVKYHEADWRRSAGD